MKRLLWGLLLLAGVGAVIVVVSRAPRRPSAPRNVVLVTIDTLRADRLGRGVAPELDRLAASGVHFTRARATVPLTLPSHVSMMTGLLPTEHGVRENGVRFPEGTPTLATVFRDAGYRTAAFVGAYVLDRRFGVSQGFEAYDDRVPRDPRADTRLEADRRAADVVDAALAWLESAARPPFLLWVHLYDPHAPYDPPPEFRARHSNPYDGEVAYASAQTGRLIEFLDRRGWRGSTVTVVAGDHGEGLGDHGERTHGMLAYDSTLEVPLVVSAPGLAPGVIDAPVSLSDLPGSILRLAGISAALATGASTRDLFEQRDGGGVYAETQYPLAAGWHPLAVLADERWKLILSSEAELYDVASDPAESSNLASSRPAIVQAMSARLTAIRSTASTRGGEAVDKELAARLGALGYVSGAVSSRTAPANAPNPAATTEWWLRFEHALSTMNSGGPSDALPALAELARRFPDGSVFQSTYARALHESGRAREAMDVLRAAVQQWPDAALYHDLAAAARAAAEPVEALRAEQAALAIEKDNPAALNGLGLLHADAGRAADAAAAFERAAAADPSNASYWSNLGNARRDLADGDGAERAYRRALEAQPDHPDASNGLGVLLVQRGKAADAVAWFERAIARAPDFHEARLNLGIAYQESGQREKAIAAYRDVLRRAPAGFVRERKAASDLLRALGASSPGARAPLPDR